MVPAEIIGWGRLIASVLQNSYETVTCVDGCSRMENALQVQRGAAHPGGSLAGEPQMNSWRTEELMILAVRRMFQPWRRATQPRPLAGLELTDRSAARFVSIGSSDACKDCSQLGTVHLRIVGNCVGVAAGVPRGITSTTGRCTGL